MVVYLLAILFIFLYLMHYARRKRSPPGPIGLPFWGILFHQMIWARTHKYRHQYVFLGEQRKKYGDISSFQMGLQTIAVMHSIDVVKEAQLEHADIFSGRPTNPFYLQMHDNSGVIGIDGERWKNQRRFSLQTLKNFGIGKKSIEPAILNEANYIISLIVEHDGQSINTRELLVKGIANVISVLLFNKRWDYQDPTLETYIKCLHNVTNVGGIGTFFPLFFPFLSKPFILKRLKGPAIFFQSTRIMKDIIHEQIKLHQKHFHKENESNDFIESFLKEMNKLDETYGKGSHDFDVKQITGLCYDLFAAGTDTTTNSLSWAFFILAVYPNVQRSLCNEIDTFIPLDKGRPEMSHKKEMVYTQAFIDEVARFCTVVPYALDKRVMKPVILRNCLINPEDIVMTNIYSIHRDPNLWDRADEFLPERFIDKDGNYHPSDNLIPFGIGKRQCLGESLARMENFLILVSVMQRFRVELDPRYANNFEDIMMGTEGLIHAPGTHRITFSNRK